MIEPVTWSIFDSDGRYLGQYTTFAPETAFCEYMDVSGKKIDAADVKSTPVNNDLAYITYGAERYLLAPNLSRVPTQELDRQTNNESGSGPRDPAIFGR